MQEAQRNADYANEHWQSCLRIRCPILSEATTNRILPVNILMVITAMILLRIFRLLCLVIAAPSLMLVLCENSQAIGGERNSFPGPETLPTSLLVDFSNPQAANETSNLLSSLISINATFIQGVIHEIKVTGYPSLGNWSLLETLFLQLGSIEIIHWDSTNAIPKSILHSLEQYNPTCRLYYTPHFTHDDPYDTSLDPEPDYDPYDSPRDTNYELREARDLQHELALKSILNSKNLYSLKAAIEYGSDDNFIDLELVFDIITSAPNLRELDLQFHVRGCLLGHSPFAFDFLSSPTARFPPLEVLKLSGYRLDERADGGYSWSWKDFERDERSEWNYETDGFPPVPERRPDDGRSNLDAWMEVMDWSHLHTLEVTYPTTSTLAKLRGRNLPALKHFALTGSWGIDDMMLAKSVMAFVSETVKPLESLSLQNINSDTWDAFLTRSTTTINPFEELRSFSFGNEENNLFIKNETISKFLAATPKLTHLDLNIPRSKSSLDLETFSAFLISSSIQYLTFRFSSPDLRYSYGQIHNNETIMEEYRSVQTKYRMFGDKDDEVDSMINCASVSNIFRKLRDSKVGKKLETLDVYVGNWAERESCDDMFEPKLRVAFYECFVGADGMETCTGSQTRSLGGF